MRTSRTHHILLLLLLFGVQTQGCSTGQYRAPPAAADRDGSRAPLRADRPVMVIGRFGNPARAPVVWADIGPGMSEALAASLRNNGVYNASVDVALAVQVTKLLSQVGDQRRRGLAALRKNHPAVQYVVTGRVTDFAHSGDLPESVRRRSIWGEKHEAVVAIRLDVVDLDAGRVVASDHIYGTAKAPDGPSREVYRDMVFGSYFFWSTPLGKASLAAVERATEVLDESLVTARRAVPFDQEPRLIAKQTGPRTLQLARDVNPRTDSGRLYFVCLVDDPSGEHRAVFDPESGLPLKARIESPGLGLTTRTAILVGRKPPVVDLRGAMLCPIDVGEIAVADD